MDGVAARELRDDLTDHVLDALAAGVDPDEICERLGSTEVVGPVLKSSEAPRSSRPDPRAGAVMEGLAGDARYALRSLIRVPTLSLTVVVILALAITANAVVFTVVNELLLRPLPVDDQSTLVDVWADVEGGNSFLGFGWHDVAAYQEVEGPIDRLAAFAGTRVLLGGPPAASPVVAQLVTREYLPLLGVSSEIGTLEMGFEDGIGADLRIVLSHTLWTDRYGADPDVVGSTVLLDERSATVVGVAEAGFRGHFIGFPVDLWAPLGAATHVMPGFDPEDRGNMPFEMIGRLTEGATPSAAHAALSVVSERLAAEFPDTHRGHRVGVTPTTGLDHSLKGPVTAFVAILTVVSILVLIIACLNVGSVLLVRTISRSREMSLRLAIGAGRARLVRQIIAESSILALVGTALGIGAAFLLNDVFSDLFRTVSAGLGLELTVDHRVLALTAVAGAGAALLAGGAPALHVLRTPPAAILQGRGERRQASWTRAALVLGQVSVSVVLVVATGLFVRAFVEAAQTDPGFNPEQVAAFTVGQRDGIDELLDDLRALPGVEDVSLADGPPVRFARTPLRIAVPGLEPPPGTDAWVVDARRVGAGYLRTVGIPLRSGRDFTDGDAEQGPPVVVVSAAFAERFWPTDEPVGRSLVVDGEALRVVGVAEDARYLAQDDEPDPLVYVSLGGDVPAAPVVTVRALNPDRSVGDIRRVVSSWSPGSRLPSVQTARAALDSALLPQRLGAALVGGMGLAALLLAVVGLYGLVQYTVTRQTPELAVRLALGGTGGSVRMIVVRRGFGLAAAGTLLGAGLAFLLTPALSGFLGSVGPRDPLVFGVVIATFVLVAFLASWMPARKASTIEPAQVLRGG